MHKKNCSACIYNCPWRHAGVVLPCARVVMGSVVHKTVWLSLFFALYFAFLRGNQHSRPRHILFKSIRRFHFFLCHPSPCFTRTTLLPSTFKHPSNEHHVYTFVMLRTWPSDLLLPFTFSLIDSMRGSGITTTLTTTRVFRFEHLTIPRRERH